MCEQNERERRRERSKRREVEKGNLVVRFVRHFLSLHPSSFFLTFLLLSEKREGGKGRGEGGGGESKRKAVLPTIPTMGLYRG